MGRRAGMGRREPGLRTGNRGRRRPSPEAARWGGASGAGPQAAASEHLRAGSAAACCPGDRRAAPPPPSLRVRFGLRRGWLKRSGRAMPKWSVRRRPSLLLGAVLLIVCLPVLRRLDWSGLGASLWRRRHLGLRADGQNFKLENSAFWIFGGSVHYFRVPRAYWRDRLLKLRACGLNTLTTYVPWNLHEPERGTFDFSGNLDLEAFILLAAEVGLWVILRPGPYICSEVDLGGLPSWLLRDPDMRLRTTYKGFTEAVDLYFDHLMLRVVPLQYKHGGPIIAVQVENEYGSYNKDPAYMPYIKKALQDRGIAELLLTSDNQGGLKSGVLDGGTSGQPLPARLPRGPCGGAVSSVGNRTRALG